VDPALVSVWVALSHAASVRLQVWRGVVSAGSAPGVFSGRAPDFPAATTTARRFGEHFHVALVELSLAATTPLVPGEIYSYLLTFTGTVTSDLKSLGLLEDAVESPAHRAHFALGYEPNFLPTFALPPLELTDLRVVHGSCRQPQGAGPDALASVDGMIRNARLDPLARPHQLLFTGDQIYADDVAMALLPELVETGRELLGPGTGFVERIPTGGDPGSLFEPTLANFPVGRRQKLMIEQAGFSSGYASSHLISFGEYCAMYLFAWSGAVWPENLRTKEQVLTSASSPPPTEGMLSPLDTSASNEARFGREVEALKVFRNSLPAVRRVLANVPTYMIFDDHEVTDDWNLSGEWRRRVLSRPLGRAVMRNALAAYAIFQGWGNDPEYFRSGDGAEVLTRIENLFPSGSNSAPATSASSALEALLGVGTAALAVRWHYRVPGTRHRVVVLDSRTQRGFASGNSPAAMLTEPQADVQIPAGPAPSNVDVTLVVAATPVLGVAAFDALDPLLENLTDLLEVSHPSSEPGQFKWDVEAWAAEPFALELLLKRLYPMGRVVILSGETHYAHAAEMTYYQRDGAPRRIAQLTASGFKKQEANATIATRSMPVAQALFGAVLHPVERVGWNGLPLPPPVEVAPPHRVPGIYIVRLHQTPVVLPVRGWPPGTTTRIPPDWAWRFRLVRDERPDDALPASVRPAPLEADVDPSNAIPGYREVARRHAEQMVKAAPRRVLWAANVGVVRFTRSDAGEVSVRHELTAANTAGHTVHVINLDAVTEPQPVIGT
jgi:hypothetical protein